MDVAVSLLTIGSGERLSTRQNCLEYVRDYQSLGRMNINTEAKKPFSIRKRVNFSGEKIIILFYRLGYLVLGYYQSYL